jgi:UDP:flavonoid glycosyltransferase YjiC (YdhE family)
MRVLFIPLAAASHYYPMVPLAWAFRAAGHEVRVAAQPPVVGSVERSGHVAVSVGGSYDLLANLAATEQTFHLETGRRLADFRDFAEMPAEPLTTYIESRRATHLRAAEVIAEELVPFARFWRPDLVVTDLVTLAGPLVAETAGVPLVHHSWGPQFPAVRMLPGFGAQVDSWSTDLRALFDRFGVQAREIYSICVVDPCPPSLQAMVVPNQIAARFVPYNGPGVVPKWLRRPAEKPRVCVSWGVTDVGMHGMDKHPLSATIDALTTLDVEVVVTVKAADRAILGQPAAGVRVAEGLPLQTVVASCAVAVNHGGAGTLLTAAAYGVPQVLLPQEQSDIFNSERLAAVGAGMLLRADEVNPDAIAAAVGSALSEDSWQKAARALQEENDAQPTPAETVRTVDRLVAAGWGR